MEPFNFFTFIFFLFTFINVLEAKSTSNICKHDQPNIHLPFKLNTICKHNHTMIIFPNYGQLGVKSITYDPKRLTLFDPKDCVFEVFLNLNLDRTPFRYYHVVKNYTYWNCSVSLSGSFEQIPCLSGSNHHVYVLESSLDVPSSCEVVKSVLIPFGYSSYVSDDSFGLDLSWDSDDIMGFVEEKRGVGVQSKIGGLSVVILVFVIVGLWCVKVYCWKKSRIDEHEWEMLLRDVETL